MPSLTTMRQRFKQQQLSQSETTHEDSGDASKLTSQRGKSQDSVWTPTARLQLSLLLVTTAALRLFRINHPAQVVFDEVHFGGFASRYLRREYYFDVHPPLGKMLIAGIAWLGGFKGGFDFEKIGMEYTGVPFTWMRSVMAMLGVASVVLAYATLVEMRVNPWYAAVTGVLLAFDTALITQVRFILLDGMLLAFMMASVFAWVRFRRLSHKPFARDWWLWLALSGVGIGATLGVKMVGLFTVLTVGAGTALDLWQLADKRRSLPDSKFLAHFLARAACLIVLPLAIYLASFYAHLAILTHTGPGDEFMSPEFQSNLIGSRLNSASRLVRFGHQIRLKNKIENIFLHSHAHNIPREHLDGKISSNGQQVNGYPEEDPNNVWRVLGGTEGDVLKDGDVIRLLHVATGKVLLTHDVASALTRTNQEITAVDADSQAQYPETLWRVSIQAGSDGGRVRSLGTQFQLVSTRYNVHLQNHQKSLPEWGFGQRELNGDKRGNTTASWWLISEVLDPLDSDEEAEIASRQPVKLSIVKRFWELQVKMLVHNSSLADDHPNQSGPLQWPFMRRGLPFWEENKRSRVYLLGSLPAWFAGLLAIVSFVMRMARDHFEEHRGWTRLNLHQAAFLGRHAHTAGFLLLAWALHYLPFFVMGRVLYLHHYLPSYMFSAMLSACMLQYIDTFRGSPRLARAIAIVTSLATITWFSFYYPIAYGLPRDPEAMRPLKLFDSWDWP